MNANRSKKMFDGVCKKIHNINDYTAVLEGLQVLLESLVRNRNKLRTTNVVQATAYNNQYVNVVKDTIHNLVLHKERLTNPHKNNLTPM